MLPKVLAPRARSAPLAVSMPLELNGSDRLVGLGFRLWLSGFRTGDIAYWEQAWSTYASSMGASAAKSAVRDLACWVRAIKQHSQRDLETATADCSSFCRDECVAIAMISACQHHACPAMRACAFALIGCSMIDEVVGVAENFANTLQGADQFLSPGLAHATPLATLPAATEARH
jgi:hypothetical protein